jgi:hypothetical protein
MDTMNQTDERITQQHAQDHPPTWAEMYGDDLGPDPFQDAPTEPAKTSTAAAMARKVKEAERAAQQRRDLGIIAQVAQEEQEDNAFDIVRRRALAGTLGKVRPGVIALAASAARRRGFGDVSTAEQLAAIAGRSG